jgi:hypothetical protein
MQCSVLWGILERGQKSWRSVNCIPTLNFFLRPQEGSSHHTQIKTHSQNAVNNSETKMD